MAVFDFPYHRQSTKYPDSGTRLQFGNSYMFTAPPEAPDQRVFTLKFPSMKYYLESDGETLDIETEAQRNLGTLEAFYVEHKLWKTFTYPHPVYGDVDVKFSKPLSIPEGAAGGGGEVKDLEIELVEQP